MRILEFVLLLLAGGIVGSFLTAVIERLPTRRPLVAGRSACPRCGAVIAPRDLIPVVSFLLLRARCRTCHAPIPRWHLAVELATVALFVLASVAGPTRTLPDLLLLGGLLATLLALTVIDLRFFLLPDVLVAAVAVVGLARAVLLGTPGLGNALLGGAAGLLLLGALALLPWPARGVLRVRERGAEAMGFGDVKLAGALGLALGLPGLAVALFLAFVAGGAAGGVLLLTRRARLTSRIPFGPFLAGATAVTLIVPGLPDMFFRFLGLS